MKGHLLRRRISEITPQRPLNVLFFGSDEFSCHSLNALVSMQKDDLLGRIQVVTKPAKPCGRNSKLLRELPIAYLADKLSIPPPIRCKSKDELLSLCSISSEYDIAIAVSFGMLIPYQLLRSIKWSLNVHPSLLPMYRGSAPLQHTLMNHDRFTGVSIQTLHPTKFDHGAIIAQTEPLNTEDIVAKGIVSDFQGAVPPKVAALMDQLGLVGSDLLQDVVRRRLYASGQSLNPPYKASLAPRISSHMHRINWATETVSTMLGKHYGLGALYAFKATKPKKKDATVMKRVLFHELQEYHGSEMTGQPGSLRYDMENNVLLVSLLDGLVACTKLQFQGFKPESPAKFMVSYNKRCGNLSELQFV